MNRKICRSRNGIDENQLPLQKEELPSHTSLVDTLPTKCITVNVGPRM
jgi:hypothetical protein